MAQPATAAAATAPSHCSPPDRCATLIDDGAGGALIELRFGWGALHLGTNAPLREWIKTLPGRRWVRARSCWLLDPALLASGVLSAAGFVVCRPDGAPARRSDIASPPRSAHSRPGADIPEWFGLELWPYQRDGALRAVRDGAMFLADEMGLGKTRTALAVAAALGARRVVVLCPPVMLTHWERETATSGVAGNEKGPPPAGATLLEPAGARRTNLAPPIIDHHRAGPTSMPDKPRNDKKVEIVVVRPGRKEPELPPAGVLIVADSLVAARPSLVARICSWSPDLLVYDEAHRAKTWGSARSRAARRIACASAASLPVTGTPMFANPAELVPTLYLSGHLDETFGGRGRFCARYLRPNRFGDLVADRRRLPELGRLLDAHVWVRRSKADVLADLPTKSRRSLWLDIDRSEVVRAAAAVNDAIDAWLVSRPEPPDDDEIWEWCRGQLGLVSTLRRSAGLAKVAPASEYVTDWVARYSAERPLVVWTHHRAVTEAMASALPGAVGSVGVIAGGTPADERTELVDRFQAGDLAALVCSIHAAGVGITLTRSADVIFVETDWTPAAIAQAEDRCHRIGQDRPVAVTTLLAPGTLDETIYATLERKAGSLDAVLPGGDHHVTGETGDGAGGRRYAAAILHGLVMQRIARRD